MSALQSRTVGAAAALAVAAALTGTMAISAPADATVPVTGGDCADSHSWSVPSAGKLTVTFKLQCTYAKYDMYHGITITGPDDHTGGGHCTSNNTIKTCTKSITFADPAGTQKWTLGDEWSTRESPYDSSSRDWIYVATLSH